MRWVRRLLGGVLVMLAAMPAFAMPQHQSWIEPELRWSAIQPGAYVVTHLKPYPANALVVEMANGDLVVCNTTYSPQAAESLLAWLHGRFGRRRMVAVNTHFHLDTLGGNAAFLRAGIPVYGSRQTATLLAERGETMRAQMVQFTAEDREQRRAMATIPYLPPSHQFDAVEGLTLRFGSEVAQVMFPGAGHAPDNLVVYFPRRQLLFGGCMIRSLPGLGNLVDADVPAWPASVSRLLGLPVRTVVPGHGTPGGRELLEHTLQELASGP